LKASLCHFGNIAYRAGENHLYFNPEKEKFVNNQEADQYLTRTYLSLVLRMDYLKD
jgi:hypothetical protein